MKTVVVLFLAAAFLQSCAVIRPGEVGVKTRFGQINDDIKANGLLFYNPFSSSVTRVPTRVINREIKMNLPSKEGLTINSDVSILYRVQPEEAITVIEEVGLAFDQIITAVFRSAAADVCSQFLAKDMHSGERRTIEKRITDLMNEYLEPRGFEVQAVLLKSINLPAGLSRAIEQKLESEQNALRMQYIKQEESAEAERILIKAEGQKKRRIIEAEARAREIEIEAEANKLANDKLNSSLTPDVLKMKQIEAMLELARSPNAKTIFMDQKNPFMNVLDR
jgi:regulator of protease activity HflC (stomatin/prohibitin superfamily)